MQMLWIVIVLIGLLPSPGYADVTAPTSASSASTAPEPRALRHEGLSLLSVRQRIAAESRNFWQQCDYSSVGVCDANGTALEKIDVWGDLDRLNLSVIPKPTPRQKRLSRAGFSLLIGAVVAYYGSAFVVSYGTNEESGLFVPLGVSAVLGASGIGVLAASSKSRPKIGDDDYEFTVPEKSIRARNQAVAIEHYPDMSITSATLYPILDESLSAAPHVDTQKGFRTARRSILPFTILATGLTTMISGLVRSMSCIDEWDWFVPILDGTCHQIARIAAGIPHGMIVGGLMHPFGNIRGAELSGRSYWGVFGMAMAGGALGGLAANQYIVAGGGGAEAILINVALTAIPAGTLAIFRIKPISEFAAVSNHRGFQLGILPAASGAGGQLVGTLTLR